jgi:hypothetical protein
MTNFVGIPMKRQMVITPTKSKLRLPFSELITDNRNMLSSTYTFSRRERRVRERREEKRREREREREREKREEREREREERERRESFHAS